MSDIQKSKNIPEKILNSIFVDDAVTEVLKSQAPEEGLENGRRGTVATPQQICGYRRRNENIIVDKIDEWTDPRIRTLKIDGYHTLIKNEAKREKDEISQRKAHRGKRSTKSLIRRANRK